MNQCKVFTSWSKHRSKLFFPAINTPQTYTQIESYRVFFNLNSNPSSSCFSKSPHKKFPQCWKNCNLSNKMSSMSTVATIIKKWQHGFCESEGEQAKLNCIPVEWKLPVWNSDRFRSWFSTSQKVQRVGLRIQMFNCQNACLEMETWFSREYGLWNIPGIHLSISRAWNYAIQFLKSFWEVATYQKPSTQTKV